MRVSLLIFAVFLCGCTAALNVGKDEEIDIDVSTIKPPNKKAKPASPVSSGDGDDDDDGSGVQGDSSGSGSGDGVVVVKPTQKPKTTMPAKTKKVRPTEVPTTKARPVTKKSKATTERENEVETVEPVEPTQEVEPTTEEEDNMLETEGEKDDEGNVQASKKDETGPKKAARKTALSNEVIAAVVVGGVCAIILIAFLVYRLRKRDEGSYALTDNSYKDTNKLRGDPGKEAFV